MQPDQLRKLTRKWAIPIIVVTILGAAASYLVSKRLTPMYAATGRCWSSPGPAKSGGSGTANSGGRGDRHGGVTLTQPALLKEVISTLHLNTTLDKLTKEISAVAESNTELVDVTVNDPSPIRAAQIANALMNAYVVAGEPSERRNRSQQAGAAIQAQIRSVASHASTRKSSSWPQSKGGPGHRLRSRECDHVE